MTFSTLDLEAEGALGRLTLNRPEKLNPLGLETLGELTDAAGWFDQRPEIKVVVVSGRGRAFCAGADVSSFAGAAEGSRPPREAADAGRVMAEAVESMRAITIASIHGHCVGGGVVLAAACDLRLAAASTRFAIPEVDLGIPLAWGGIPRLVREIGPAMTKELVLSCRPFTAEEGMGLGFINRVLPDEELGAAVESLAAELSLKSSLTLTATKLAVNAASREMASTAGAWNDADTLLGAFSDAESRRVGQEYLKQLRR